LGRAHGERLRERKVGAPRKALEKGGFELIPARAEAWSAAAEAMSDQATVTRGGFRHRVLSGRPAPHAGIYRCEQGSGRGK